MMVRMGWRELRHGFDRQLSVAQQRVGQLPGCVARLHPLAQASRRWRGRAVASSGLQ
ncbi:hypothetical protein [Aeromonas sobria]|uniref:hypothetical protein n=1 Tax=Aeromonas sobria TaxID=646 RepID=UPI003F50FF1A